MRKTVAVLAASGALLAGCGGGESLNQAPEVPAKTTVPTPVSGYTGKEPTKAYKRACRRAPICHTLVEFRQRVQEKHMAKVLLGLCIAWPNRDGGITVTVNPGTVKGGFKGGTFSYPVFSNEESAGDAAYVQQMNGPVSVVPNEGKPFDEIPDVALELFGPGGTVKTRDRPLSEDPVRDQAGNLHYEDSQTGVPLMATGLVQGQLDEQTFAASCKALREQIPLPGVR